MTDTLNQYDKIAKVLHYPDHWDTAAYPTLYDAIYELAGCNGCSECNQGGRGPDADQKPNSSEIRVNELDEVAFKKFLEVNGHASAANIEMWKTAIECYIKCIEAPKRESIEENKILRAYILKNLPFGGSLSAHVNGLKGEDIINNILKVGSSKIEGGKS